MNRRRRKKLSKRLFGAIQAGDVVAVKALLGAGVDPRCSDGEGTTPLYAAAVNGEAAIVGLLLSSGASPDVESRGVGAEGTDRKSTRLNSSHERRSRMPSSA